MLHIALHFILPLLVAVIMHRKHWRHSWFWMLTAFVIDVDHLLADPIYDAARCSIGFHPLHSAPAMVFFAVALLLITFLPVLVPDKPHTRAGWPLYRLRLQLFLAGVGIHLALDALDCVF